MQTAPLVFPSTHMLSHAYSINFMQFTRCCELYCCDYIAVIVMLLGSYAVIVTLSSIGRHSLLYFDGVILLLFYCGLATTMMLVTSHIYSMCQQMPWIQTP